MYKLTEIPFDGIVKSKPKTRVNPSIAPTESNPREIIQTLLLFASVGGSVVKKQRKSGEVGHRVDIAALGLEPLLG